MKSIIRYAAIGLILAFVFGSAAVSAAIFRPVSSGSPESEGAALAAAAASGVPRNMPVIGRLLGADNVLFRTSVDIQNNTDTATTVTFFLHGTDLTTGEAIAVSGNVTNDATDELMKGFSNFHSDDLIGDLVALQVLPTALLEHGFLGSGFVIFNGFGSGQGSMQARFYSEVGSSGGAMSGGTIGVSLNSNDIGRNEPRSLFGMFRDSRGISGTPQLYSNMFLNNVGYVNESSLLVGDTIDVRLTAYSTTTGAPAGTVRTVRIGPFQTVGVPEVLKYLGISAPEADDTIIVAADVVSGLSAIQGVGAHIDQTTKDPSGFEMHDVRAIQPTLANVTGTWNITFTITAKNGDVPNVGTHIPGRMTLITSGPNVSGTLYAATSEGGWGIQLAGTLSTQGGTFTITQTTACTGALTGTGSMTLAADGNHIDGSYSGSDNCGRSVSATFTAGRVF